MFSLGDNSRESFDRVARGWHCSLVSRLLVVHMFVIIIIIKTLQKNLHCVVQFVIITAKIISCLFNSNNNNFVFLLLKKNITDIEKCLDNQILIKVTSKVDICNYLFIYVRLRNTLTWKFLCHRFFLTVYSIVKL